MKYIHAFILAACPVLANIMIHNVGYDCLPCLLPVAPGLWTASGVYVAGLSLAMRDVVHERFGAVAAFACIMIGSALSALVSPVLAAASAGAFIAAELSDTVIYAAARRWLARHWAVMLSGVFGAVVDGLAFVWLAFGALDLASGNIIGKLYASAALALFWWWRARD